MPRARWVCGGCGVPPASGQQFLIPLDGRAVRARIMRFSGTGNVASGRTIPNVYADEI